MIINVWHPLASLQHFSLGFSRHALSWLGPEYLLGICNAQMANCGMGYTSLDNAGNRKWDSTDLEGELPFS